MDSQRSNNAERRGGAQASANSYDMIVVGTGIGATGFIRRLKQFESTRTLRILWLDSAPERRQALTWPADLVKESKAGNVPQFKCSSQEYVWALSWRAFGGGDALNSGGPNNLGIHRDAEGKTIPDLDPPPMPPSNPQLTPNPSRDDKTNTNVFHLRNNSVHPESPLGERFIEGFRDALGWEVKEVLPATSGADPDVASVGYPSSIYAEGSETRMLIARDLAPPSATDDEASMHVTTLKLGCKVKRVLFSDDNKAIGVECKNESVECKNESVECKNESYYADKVVLAAGVFGTFDLLINSGIGKKDYLERRGVAPRGVPREVADAVGTGIGDESQVTVLFCPAEKQPPSPPEGIQSPLVGWKSADGKLAGVVWPSDLPSLYLLYTRSPVIEFLDSLPIWIWGIGLLSTVYAAVRSWFVRLLFDNYGFVGVSLDTPTNRKLVIKEEDPERIEYNDDDVNWTDEMKGWYNEALPGLKSALEANENAFGFFERPLPRLLLWKLDPILRYIVGGWLSGGVVTSRNLIPEYKKNELVSYQHYYGGCGDDVVDDQYAVIGVRDLHVCDATVITKFGRKLLPGAPSTTIMQQGMRVADAMYPPPKMKVL